MGPRRRTCFRRPGTGCSTIFGISRSSSGASPIRGESSSTPQADAEVVEEELDVAVQRAVQSLPDRCREVFELSRVHGLKYAGDRANARDLGEDGGGANGEGPPDVARASRALAAGPAERLVGAAPNVSSCNDGPPDGGPSHSQSMVVRPFQLHDSGPRGRGRVQLRVVPFSVITTLAVAVPSYVTTSRRVTVVAA